MMGRPISQTRSARRAQRVRALYDAAVIPLDAPDLARPARPCSRCGVVFQPSTRRRMLCATCYSRARILG